jgi:hypothetical protein
VQYEDAVGIKLVAAATYTDARATNNKVVYQPTPAKFLFGDFKKKATELVYADPQAVDKDSKKFRHISFTTQSKVAKTLGLSPATVSRITKSLPKVFQFELALVTRNYDDAVKAVYFHRTKCKIVRQLGRDKTTEEFLVYRLVGSKLCNSHILWFKYKDKCIHRLTTRHYQLLDSDHPTEKIGTTTTGQNAKRMNSDQHTCYYSAVDYNRQTVIYKRRKVSQNTQSVP